MRRIRAIVEYADGLSVADRVVDVLDDADKAAMLGILESQENLIKEQYDRIKIMEGIIEELREEMTSLNRRISYLEIENKRLVL